MKTKNKTGIWIDNKKALIVQLNNGKETVQKILSGIESRVRIPGEGKKFTRMGKQYFSFEKKNDEKHKHQLNGYFNNVIDKIKDADAIVIMGPAEAKMGLRKEMSKSNLLSSKPVSLISEGYLTEKQIVASVKKLFGYKKEIITQF